MGPAVLGPDVMIRQCRGRRFLAFHQRADVAHSSTTRSDPCRVRLRVPLINLICQNPNASPLIRGWPISRILFPPDRDPGFDDHSSGPAVANGIKLPTRAFGPENPGRRRPQDPYLALLRVGLAMRALLPAPRWALTPPFHRDPGSSPGQSVLCGAFPRVAPAGRYPAPLFCRVRTFLAYLATHAIIQPSA
jgi:hypothetical protein